MKFSEAAAVFGANFDQIESLGVAVVEKAISSEDDGSGLDKIVEVFNSLNEKRASAMASGNKPEALVAMFGLIGIGHILDRVMASLCEEGENKDE